MVQKKRIKKMKRAGHSMMFRISLRIWTTVKNNFLAFSFQYFTIWEHFEVHLITFQANTFWELPKAEIYLNINIWTTFLNEKYCGKWNCVCFVSKPVMSAPKYNLLKNVHSSLPSPSKGETYLTRYTYLYHHYCCDGVNDVVNIKINLLN